MFNSLVGWEHNVFDQRNRQDTTMMAAPNSTRFRCDVERGEDNGDGPLKLE